MDCHKFVLAAAVVAADVEADAVSLKAEYSSIRSERTAVVVAEILGSEPERTPFQYVAVQHVPCRLDSAQ